MRWIAHLVLLVFGSLIREQRIFIRSLSFGCHAIDGHSCEHKGVIVVGRVRTGRRCRRPRCKDERNKQNVVFLTVMYLATVCRDSDVSRSSPPPMICSRNVFRCFKTLERWGDKITGAAGPYFVGLAVILISTGTVCFCKRLYPCLIRHLNYL